MDLDLERAKTVAREILKSLRTSTEADDARRRKRKRAKAVRREAKNSRKLPEQKVNLESQSSTAIGAMRKIERDMLDHFKSI